MRWIFDIIYDLLTFSIRKLPWTTSLVSGVIGALVAFLAVALSLNQASHAETFMIRPTSLTDMLWGFRKIVLVAMALGATLALIGAGIFELIARHIQSPRASQLLIYLGGAICTLPLVIVIYLLLMFVTVY